MRAVSLPLVEAWGLLYGGRCALNMPELAPVPECPDCGGDGLNKRTTTHGRPYGGKCWDCSGSGVGPLRVAIHVKGRVLTRPVAVVTIGESGYGCDECRGWSLCEPCLVGHSPGCYWLVSDVTVIDPTPW